MMKILLMVFFVQEAFILSALCGKGFEWCQYKFFTQPRKWNDAVAICRHNNKSLAHILDTSEAEVISEFLESSVYEKSKVSDTFWIGMRMKANNFLLPDCNVYSNPDSLYSSLLTETSRENGCFYMNRNGGHELKMEECTSSRQFLCKASTLDLDTRSCYTKQHLASHLSGDEKVDSITDIHSCEKECEKIHHVAYLTTSKNFQSFACSFYTYKLGSDLRPVDCFIRDILDTKSYPEVTATEMCDMNTKDSAMPSSVGYLTTEHGLDTSVPEPIVESRYSTPLLDDFTLPTAIVTKPTKDHHVASRFTSVRSGITNTQSSKEHSGTVSDQKDMRSNEEPLPDSTAHLTTEHVLGSSIPENTVLAIDDSTFPTVISVSQTTDPEMSSLSTIGVTTGDCNPSKILPQIGKLSNYSCYCGCGNSTNVTMTNEQLVKKKQELRQQLIINKESLSSWKRKHTSAKDDRTSARNIGYVGVAIIIAILVVIVMIDMPRFLAFMKHLRTHTRSFNRRLAPKTESHQKAPQKKHTGKTNQSSVPMNELNLPKRRRLVFLDDSCC